ncbi:MAG: hypothetical protein HYV35_10450 [Lentisphaerae bacterium]|nr:hypothetical protein [Lentisphaerota bacterium]
MKTKLVISILLLMNFPGLSDSGAWSVGKNFPCGVNIKFIGPGGIKAGASASWYIVLTNSSVSNWTYAATLQVDAIGYDGELWEHLFLTRTSNVLAAGSSTTIIASVESTNIIRILV